MHKVELLKKGNNIIIINGHKCFSEYIVDVIRTLISLADCRECIQVMCDTVIGEILNNEKKVYGNIVKTSDNLNIRRHTERV